MATHLRIVASPVAHFQSQFERSLPTQSSKSSNGGTDHLAQSSIRCGIGALYLNATCRRRAHEGARRRMEMISRSCSLMSCRPVVADVEIRSHVGGVKNGAGNCLAPVDLIMSGKGRLRSWSGGAAAQFSSFVPRISSECNSVNRLPAALDDVEADTWNERGIGTLGRVSILSDERSFGGRRAVRGPDRHRDLGRVVAQAAHCAGTLADEDVAFTAAAATDVAQSSSSPSSLVADEIVHLGGDSQSTVAPDGRRLDDHGRVLQKQVSLASTTNLSHSMGESSQKFSLHGDGVGRSHATESYAGGAGERSFHVGKKVSLFYCDETKDLAEKIAAENEHIELEAVQWGHFADGFPNLFVPNAHGIRNRHVAFLASFSSPAVIFEQLSVIYALPRMFVASFTLVLPFFPTGTVERMEDEGDIATAFTLSRILSNIPLSRGGPTSVVIFDIHALQERFYFGDYVHPFFESGIPLLKERLRQLPDHDNICIAFPDEGAWKRFYKQFIDFDTIICTKVRDGNRRIVRLKEGNPEGHHVVIVDDLVQSGGTLIECQKVLTALGASCVSAYATHGVFPKQSWKRFLPNGEDGTSDGRAGVDGFANFWITDSCPRTVQEVEGIHPFEILSLAKSISAALQI